MKKALSLIVAIMFTAGIAGSAIAQTQTAPKAEEKKTEDKKMDKAAEKKPAAKTASGTVKSAAADSIVVSGKDKGKDAEWTFAVDAKTKISKAGKNITAADVKAGDSVQVRYTEEGGKAMAQSVSVRQAPPAKKAEAKDMKKEEKPAEKK